MSFVSQGTVALPAQPAVPAALPYAAAGSQRQSIFKMTGTGAFLLPSAASLGNGGYIWTQNASTGIATLTAIGGDTLDGVVSYKSYPGELRLIQSDGSAAFTSIVLAPFAMTVTASMNFEKPTGYQFFDGLLWSGGASGGKTQAGGGAGGACVPFRLRPAALAASEVLTIGAGGAAQTVADTAGNAGGDSSIGSLVVSYGGGPGGGQAGVPRAGGGGGGALSAGSAGGNAASTITGGSPQSISVADTASNSGLGGAGSVSSKAGAGAWGGGAGGPFDVATGGGKSVYGGGGGGGGSSSAAVRSGGTSVFGGSGGNGGANGLSGADGAAPGGGGGGTDGGAQSGAGARGQCEIRGVT